MPIRRDVHVQVNYLTSEQFLERYEIQRKQCLYRIEQAQQELANVERNIENCKANIARKAQQESEKVA